MVGYVEIVNHVKILDDVDIVDGVQMVDLESQKYNFLAFLETHF
ncbi:MAG: hypothetical protein Q8893_02690 [Candidatus Phytoplasma australasiaticum]|nr:hypothetical protein [Candidatus Phytoplasma australasiaticum]